MSYSFDNNIPIYIQIINNIKIDIISGKLKCNEKIPSVREFASIYKVNPNTIQKSLMELENIGLIYTDRTNGKYVTNDQRIIDRIKEEYSLSIVNNYFNDMEKIGINKKEAIKYLKEEN